MRKLATPKRVTLPTGITFLARYKKLTRSAELPDNVIMARRYRGRVVAGRRRRSPRTKNVQFITPRWRSRIQCSNKMDRTFIIIHEQKTYLPFFKLLNNIKKEKIKDIIKQRNSG